jgi:DnaJ-class molecular chaperone
MSTTDPDDAAPLDHITPDTKAGGPSVCGECGGTGLVGAEVCDSCRGTGDVEETVRGG